jgi:hypothetical protein
MVNQFECTMLLLSASLISESPFAVIDSSTVCGSIALHATSQYSGDKEQTKVKEVHFVCQKLPVTSHCGAVTLSVH